MHVWWKGEYRTQGMPTFCSMRRHQTPSASMPKAARQLSPSAGQHSSSARLPVGVKALRTKVMGLKRSPYLLVWVGWVGGRGSGKVKRCGWGEGGAWQGVVGAPRGAVQALWYACNLLSMLA